MTTLKTVFRSNPRGWVAAKILHVNPKAFASALHYQNTCLANNYVVQLTRITEEQMSHLRKPICQNIPAILDIVDTKHTPTTGRYNVMVHKDAFKKVREYLNTNLQEMMSTYVPEDIPSHPDGSPSVMMNDNGDDHSSGDESYLSLSAASFASIDISVMSGETPFEFEMKNKNRSWADVISKQDASHLPPEALIAMMQHDAQLWSDLLWASGGALELPKCTYHFIYFDFTPTGEPCMRPGQVGPPLSILSGDRKTCEISNFAQHSQLTKHLATRKIPPATREYSTKCFLIKVMTQGNSWRAVCTSTQRHLDILFRHLSDKHRIPIGQLSFQFEGIDDYSEEGYEHHLYEMRILS
jgi:hypothetical protein